jgi:hypothetical protein
LVFVAAAPSTFAQYM